MSLVSEMQHLVNTQVRRKPMPPWLPPILASAGVMVFALIVILLGNVQWLDTVGAIGIVLIWFGIALAIYFIPTIVAYNRKHKHLMAIFFTNLFLGWTFLGWVAALIWSCMNTVRSEPAKPVVDVRWQLLRSE
jgi:hypothetical protein